MDPRPRPRLLAASVLALAAALLAPVGGAGARRARGPSPEPPGLGHFECYRADFSDFDRLAVRLDDQFSQDDRRAEVLRPNLFCNPVRKTHAGQAFPILDRDNHLKSYEIETADITDRQVNVRNQFGDQVLEVVAPRSLLVPTRKFPHGRPTGLSHFKCYSVRGPLLEERVRLRDQFNEFRTTVLRPRLLCNPAKKIHGDRVFRARNPEAHLVCYRIASEPFDRDVAPRARTRNQFGRERLRAIQASHLCAPSFKLIA